MMQFSAKRIVSCKGFFMLTVEVEALELGALD